MKSFFILFVTTLFIGSSVNAQEIDLDQADAFWNSNIQAILDGDVAKVVTQTNFPLTTFEGDWTEEEFRSNFEVIFDEVTLADLASQDLTDIQVVEDEEGLTYMIVLLTTFEIEEEFYESATILSFMEIEGDWKLYRIDIAG